jgi:hypothetical protein
MLRQHVTAEPGSAEALRKAILDCVRWEPGSDMASPHHDICLHGLSALGLLAHLTAPERRLFRQRLGAPSPYLRMSGFNALTCFLKRHREVAPPTLAFLLSEDIQNVVATAQRRDPDKDVRTCAYYAATAARRATLGDRRERALR